MKSLSSWPDAWNYLWLWVLISSLGTILNHSEKEISSCRVWISVNALLSPCTLAGSLWRRSRLCFFFSPFAADTFSPVHGERASVWILLNWVCYSSCLCRAGVSTPLLTSGAAKKCHTSSLFIYVSTVSWPFSSKPGFFERNEHLPLCFEFGFASRASEVKQPRPEPHFVATHVLTIKPLMTSRLMSKVEALDFDCSQSSLAADFVSVLGIGSEFNLS